MAEALSAEALLFLQAELGDVNSNLFQVTPEQYYNERVGLKELLGNRESVEALVRDIALVDPLAYRTHPEYFQEVMNAKGQGSTDGIGNLVTAPADAVVWAAGAVACPSCAMEDLQAVWDAVQNLPEDLSYKGYLDTLHIMQGGGAEVIRQNAASSTELGAGLGLGAAVTRRAARALILERIGVVKGADSVSNVAFFERQRAGYAAQEIRSAQPVGSALKDDPLHRAPSYVVDQIPEKGRLFTIRGGDGKSYNLTQMEGAVDGRTGIFEWLVNSKGELTHQRFIPSGKITGTPNQVPTRLPR